MESLTTYVPVSIVRGLLAQKKKIVPFLQHYRTVVLFADVSGFTALCEFMASRERGDEKMAGYLNSYFELLVKILSSQGGDVFKFAGDALLVIWPRSLDEIRTLVRRAAQCALEIKRNLTDAKLGKGVTLNVKVGIGVGKVAILHVGGVFERMEYLATGEPLIQAFKAEHHCVKSDVVVSPECWQKIKRHFEADVTEDGHAFLKRCINPLTKVSGQASKQRIVIQADTIHKLMKYVPRTVLPYLDNSDEKWASELRRITVLFCNLGIREKDLNSIAEEGDINMIHTILRAVQEAVYSFEGSLNKFLIDDKGSTLIAVFGLPPLAHDNDPLRGILGALEIHKRLVELDYALIPAIGVTTGEAFCGVVGSRGRREYSVLGDTVNLSARLMQHATKLGYGVLCDSTTEFAARKSISFTKLDEIKVKGKSHLVPIFRPASRNFHRRRLKELAEQKEYVFSPQESKLAVWKRVNMQVTAPPTSAQTQLRQFASKLWRKSSGKPWRPTAIRYSFFTQDSRFDESHSYNMITETVFVECSSLKTFGEVKEQLYIQMKQRVPSLQWGTLAEYTLYFHGKETDHELKDQDSIGNISRIDDVYARQDIIQVDLRGLGDDGFRDQVQIHLSSLLSTALRMNADVDENGKLPNYNVVEKQRETIQLRRVKSVKLPGFNEDSKKVILFVVGENSSEEDEDEDDEDEDEDGKQDQNQANFKEMEVGEMSLDELDAITRAASVDQSSSSSSLPSSPLSNSFNIVCTPPSADIEKSPLDNAKNTVEPVKELGLTALTPPQDETKAVPLESPASLAPPSLRARSLSHLLPEETAPVGKIIIIEGDAGIGKSKLLASFISECPWVTIVGAGNPFDRSALNVWGDIFVQILDQWMKLALALNHDKASSHGLLVTRAIVDDSYIPKLHLLNHLVGTLQFPVPAEFSMDDLSEDEILHIQIILLRQIMSEFTKACPLIVVIDDGVTIDSETWGLARLFITENPNLTIVVGTRPFNRLYVPRFQIPSEDRKDIWEDDHTEFVHLKPHGDQVMEGLLAKNFGVEIDTLPKAVRRFLLQKSKGNPRVLTEICHEVKKAGLVTIKPNGTVRLDAKWSRAVFDSQQVAKVPLPTTLASALGSALDRLDHVPGMILKTCAVIGDYFGYHLVLEAFPQQIQDYVIFQNFLNLLELDILRKIPENEHLDEGSGGENIYTFSNGFMRDMVLSRMINEQIKTMEKRVAKSRNYLSHRNNFPLNMQVYCDDDQGYLGLYKNESDEFSIRYFCFHKAMHALCVFESIEQMQRSAQFSKMPPLIIFLESAKVLLEDGEVFEEEEPEYILEEPGHTDRRKRRWSTLEPSDSRSEKQLSFLRKLSAANSTNNNNNNNNNDNNSTTNSKVLDGKGREPSMSSISELKEMELDDPESNHVLSDGLDDFEVHILRIQTHLWAKMQDYRRSVRLFEIHCESREQLKKWQVIVFQHIQQAIKCRPKVHRRRIRKREKTPEEIEAEQLNQLVKEEKTKRYAFSPDERAQFEHKHMCFVQEVGQRKILHEGPLEVQKFTKHGWKTRYAILTKELLVFKSKQKSDEITEIIPLDVDFPTLTQPTYDLENGRDVWSLAPQLWYKRRKDDDEGGGFFSCGSSSNPEKKTYSSHWMRRSYVFHCDQEEDAHQWVSMISGVLDNWVTKRARTRLETHKPLSNPKLSLKDSKDGDSTTSMDPSSKTEEYKNPDEKKKSFDLPKAMDQAAVNGQQTLLQRQHPSRNPALDMLSQCELALQGLDDKKRLTIAEARQLLIELRDKAKLVCEIEKVSSLQRLTNNRASSSALSSTRSQYRPSQTTSTNSNVDGTVTHLLNTAEIDLDTRDWISMIYAREKQQQISRTGRKQQISLNIPRVLGAASGEGIHSYQAVDEWDWDIWDCVGPNLTLENLMTPLMYMFRKYALLDQFDIDSQTMSHFFHAILEGYINENPYHNFIHAVDVCQTSHVMMSSFFGHHFVTPLEHFALLIAALGHDLRHPAKNNNFQVNAQTPMAMMYNDQSVLEHHHCFSLFALLQDPRYGILQGLDPKQRKSTREVLCGTILATDMTHHFALIEQFNSMLKKSQPQVHENIAQKEALFIAQEAAKGNNINNENNNNEKKTGESNDLLTVPEETTSPNGEKQKSPSNVDDDGDGFTLQSPLLESAKDRLLALKIILHGADISNPCKKFPTSKKWSDLVLEEFFAQGDVEKEMGLPVSMGCDRNSINQNSFTLNFIDFIVAPIFVSTFQMLPEASACLDQLAANRQEWHNRLCAEISKDEKLSEEERDKQLATWESRASNFQPTMLPHLDPSSSSSSKARNSMARLAKFLKRSSHATDHKMSNRALSTSSTSSETSNNSVASTRSLSSSQKSTDNLETLSPRITLPESTRPTKPSSPHNNKKFTIMEKLVESTEEP